MKFLLALSTIFVTSAAFMAPAPQSHYITSTSTSLYASTTEVSKFVQGPRIVFDELPIVYVYDHCPFCVRVRLALGVKNVKHNVHFFQNDDIPTPTKLIGKKIAPIFVSFTSSLIICHIITISIGSSHTGPKRPFIFLILVMYLYLIYIYIHFLHFNFPFIP